MIKNNSARVFKYHIKGFTLIELIVVMVLLGVMAVGITSFIGLATQTYVNVSARDELIASARFAIERLNREIRNAVPNSVRVRNDTRRQCIEFIPIIASTIYTDIPVVPEPVATTIKVIPFQNEFHNGDYTCSPNCFDLVTVYPLSDTDLYSPSFTGSGKVFNLSPFTPPLGQNEWEMGLVPPLPFLGTGNRFDASSPTNRLYIFRLPVSYCVGNNQLNRYEGHGFTQNQLLQPTGGSSLMAENVATLKVTDLPFKLQNANLQRNAIVQLKIHFQREDEDIVFNNDIHLINTP